MSMTSGDERIRVVEFWYMLELLNPQTLPKMVDRSQTERVIDWTFGEALPWNYLKPVERPEDHLLRWRHMVYLGIYELRNTYEILQRAFGEDEAAYDEYPPGSSACAGLVVGPDGRLIPGSAVLSSALWTVGRLQSHVLHGGPLDLSDFEQANAAFRARTDSIVEQHRSGNGGLPVLTGDILLEILNAAHEQAQVSTQRSLATWSARIASSAKTTRKAESPQDNEFLNSFYLDDLTRTRERLEGDDIGDALQQYLTPSARVTGEERQDIISRTDVVEAGVIVKRIPFGRWPSPPEHPLARSQQFAVNQALNDLADKPGLIGVNGPPGTGKTTMLRDIVAGNIVKRAKKLAEMDDPMRAFLHDKKGRLHKLQWHSGGYNYRLPILNSDLTGFEMIVASANNGAVENITVELPLRKAIDEQWRAEANYFADLASAVLTETREANRGAAQAADAWGMVAACLGRSYSRERFRNAFWFSQHRRGTDGKEETIPPPRMLDRIKEWHHNPTSTPSWTEAKKRFLDAEGSVAQLLSDRHRCEARFEQSLLLNRRRPEADRTVSQVSERIRRLEEILYQQEAHENEAREWLDRATARLERHVALKPGILETLLTLGASVRQWRAELTPITHDLQAAEATLAQRAGSTRITQQGLRSQQQDLSTAIQARDELVAELQEVQKRCQADIKRLGRAHPAQMTGDDYELRAPWLDHELDTARSELFLAALDLHKAFIANTTKAMYDGLKAAINVVGGTAPKNLDCEAITAAWQLFFLVVPVVSTTFASASRMLEGVGKAGIGWLLIDEAGQAAPQYAVGAIWHAKRVVVVGDPLQLEPIVTMPDKAKADLAQAYGVSEVWIPPSASVQTLADRVSTMGTWLQRGDDPVWVGSPLRVHRRCDEPMFSLCNKIAYNGLMVSAVSRKSSPSGKKDLIQESSWFDIKATHQGTHVQDEQITRLVEEVDALRRMRVSPRDIIAVSPFKAVAKRLDSLSRRDTCKGMCAGTIHTAQGREASVVFLVLGGAPDRPGARRWAASSVNLVNVATSRAQRRLYVIGDLKAWGDLPYFKDLAAVLHIVRADQDRPSTIQEMG